MNPIVRIAAAAGLATVLVGGSIYLLGRNDGGFGGQPTPAAPTATAAPSQTANVGACRLVTSTEVASIAGDPGLGALPTQTDTGDVSTCTYRDGGGNVVLRLEQTRRGGEAAFGAVRDRPGVEAIADLADAAVYDPATFTLHILQGDTAVAIVARSFLDVPAEPRDTALAIGQLVVERL